MPANINVYSNPVKYSLAVQGNKNKIEPISIENFYDLILVFDVNDI